MTTKKTLSAEAKRQKEAADRLLADPARLDSWPIQRGSSRFVERA